jgi:hypothetical protein
MYKHCTLIIIRNESLPKFCSYGEHLNAPREKFYRKDTKTTYYKPGGLNRGNKL